MAYYIASGDVGQWAKAWRWRKGGAGAAYHAILCDPPYEIEFMGKRWDNAGTAYDKRVWAALYNCLLPGGFMFVFGGSRTFHKVATAIEFSGFEIHPALVWLNGGGFPKATSVARQIEQAPARGARFVTAGYTGATEATGGSMGAYEPETEAGAVWADYRYGKQALKPAAEFIVCAQKPYDGQPVESITRYGAGAFNIEGARLGGEGGTNGLWSGGGFNEGWRPKPKAPASKRRNGSRSWFTTTHPDNLGGDDNIGRWPPNVALTGVAGPEWTSYFANTEYTLETVEPFLYTPKAPRWQREAGLESMQPSTVSDGRPKPIDNPYQRGKTKRVNTHPTVKPLALTRWLASLLLPPPEYAPRRLLVPFSGSGSEMIGGLLAGWDVVQGVELVPDYIRIARKRLDFWGQFGGMSIEDAEKAAREVLA